MTKRGTMNRSGKMLVKALGVVLLVGGYCTTAVGQSLPSVEDVWFLDKPFKGCDGEMRAEPPGDDQFERHENESKRKSLKAANKDKTYRLKGSTDWGGDLQVELTKYDFKKNKQTVVLSVGGGSFTGTTKKSALACSGDKIDKAYCLGFCMWGADYCENEHECTWKDGVHDKEMKIPLSVESAKLLSKAKVTADMTVRVTGIVRREVCVKESYECDDLDQKPEKSNAGPEDRVRLDMVSLVLRADGKVVFEEGVVRKPVAKKATGGSSFRVGKGKTKGSCSGAQIQKVLQSNVGALASCGKKHPGVTGKMKVGWSVNKSGKAGKLKALKSSISEPAVQKCIQAKLKKVRWPKSPDNSCKVQWTFLFGK